MWPAIQADFSLPLSAVNYVTVLVSGCTVLSSMFGARLVNKCGTWAVVSGSMVLAALALLGFSFAPGLALMCLFAIPLGLGAGAIDAALNNYIALYYSTMHMNFLHCFYGVGVIISPTVMSMMLESATWRKGYRVIFLIQGVIALCMLFSMPLWGKNGHKKEKKRSLPLRRRIFLI